MPLSSSAPQRGCFRMMLALAASVIPLLTDSVAAQGVRDVDSTSVAPGVRVLGALVGASRAVVDSNDARRAAAFTFSELMQARAASVDVIIPP